VKRPGPLGGFNERMVRQEADLCIVAMTQAQGRFAAGAAGCANEIAVYIDMAERASARAFEKCTVAYSRGAQCL